VAFVLHCACCRWLGHGRAGSRPRHDRHIHAQIKGARILARAFTGSEGTPHSQLDEGTDGAGVVLIILGVIAEFATEGLVSRADGTLQTFNDILLSDARKEAAFAIERSAGAYERAAKTEQEASQENERAAQALNAAEVARKNAEGFQLEIAKANERAARAEQEAAEANKAAESERIERLKLEASIAGRRLTAEQKEKLKSLLKPFAPTMIELEWTGPGGQEAADLASDINDAIVGAGIPITQANRTIRMDQYFKGVLLRVGDDRKVEAEVIALFLIESNLSTRPVPTLPPNSPQRLAIVIGAKP